MGLDLSWSAAILPLAVAAGLLYVPALALWVLGARWWQALTLAPAVAVASAGAGAVVGGLFGVRWGPLVYAAVLGLVLALALVLRLALRSVLTWSPRTRADLGAFAGAAVGGLVIALALKRGFITPMGISQTFDNVFHLNALRYILETGDGSSLTMISMTQAGKPPSFYPAAWHDLVALVAEITAAPIPVAINATNIALAATVWPLAAVYLARTVVGARPGVLALVGVTTAAFSGFPYLLLDFGVLYPNFLSFVLAPVLIASTVGLFGLDRERTTSRAAHALVAVIAAGAVAISHPGGLMMCLALAWVIAAVAAVRAFRADTPAAGSRSGVGCAARACSICCGARCVRPRRQPRGGRARARRRRSERPSGTRRWNVRPRS